MAHFEIKDLTFSYPAAEERSVLKDINLSIEQGQYITLCGRSGSGKTTLLKHLKTVLRPHGVMKGEILFEGKPIDDADLREQSSKIGYVMQNPDNQIVTDKVWHELAFGLESLGMDQKTIRLRVAEMASYFGIQGWFRRNVSDLSGGQKQLLNLASIMAMQPTVLILDEPTSQLDPIAASDFLNTVRKINLELGTTIIITEHRLEDIFHASDRVVVMDQGRIIADDEPHRIGEFLKNGNNEMFAAMPSPVQIYYGVKNSLECPLTVREGRNWLSEILRDRVPEKTRVGDEKTLDDIGTPAVIVKEAWFRYEQGCTGRPERGELRRSEEQAVRHSRGQRHGQIDYAKSHMQYMPPLQRTGADRRETCGKVQGGRTVQRESRDAATGSPESLRKEECKRGS